MRPPPSCSATPATTRRRPSCSDSPGAPGSAPFRNGRDLGVAGRYRRPFLHVDRQTARKACMVQALPVWDDPHNADPAYTRSRLRHEGLPALEKALGKGVVEALARTAQLSRDDADALDAWAARAEASVRDATGLLECAKLFALPPAVRRRIVRRAAIDAGAPAVRSSPGTSRRSTASSPAGAVREPSISRASRGSAPGWQTGDPARLTRTVRTAGTPSAGGTTESDAGGRERHGHRPQVGADHQGRDRREAGGAGSEDRRGVRGQGPADRRCPQGRGDGHGGPGARAVHPGHDGLDGRLVVRSGHPVLRRRPDPQGPGHRHQGQARPYRPRTSSTPV
ncbi:tRNA(Ile)-lysidine synthase [Streptomyces alboniger]